MMTRRQFTGALSAVGLGAAELPKLRVVVVPKYGPAIEDAVSFTRAYAACPSPDMLRASILKGAFPHARSAPQRFRPAEEQSSDTPVLFISEPSDETPFESTVRIRMALQHPRLRHAGLFHHFASTVDIAPTLYALAGVAGVDEFHGRDLSPLLLADKGERPESVYAEGRLNTPEEWRMVVRGLDKLVVRPNLEVLHLYNLGEDPDEMRNLAQEAGHQLRIDELTALVRLWMKRTGDGMEPSGLRRR
jgi:hypothetical protein